MINPWITILLAPHSDCRKICVRPVNVRRGAFRLEPSVAIKQGIGKPVTRDWKI